MSHSDTADTRDASETPNRGAECHRGLEKICGTAAEDKQPLPAFFDISKVNCAKIRTDREPKKK